MAFLKRLDPREGVVDFWSEFRRPNPYRWPILGASFLMTGTLMFAFTQERVYIPPERPEVEYITSFKPGRTDEEIIASNIANQAEKDERAARLEAIEERKRELFRTLGKVSGMDVDEIERKAAEERAIEEAAEAARRDELMGRTAPSAQTPASPAAPASE